MTAKRLVLGLTLAACATAAHAQPPQVRGRWIVTGSFCSPGGCAVSDSEARGWRGRAATYEASVAGFPGRECRQPGYTVGYWPSPGTYGGATFARLGLAGDSAMVVSVACSGAPRGSPDSRDTRWDAPGAFLVVKDVRHLLMVWESRYFELERR